MTPEKLIAFFNAPGLADEATIREVHAFLVAFQDMLDIYRPALGEPVGLSVSSKLRTVAFYAEYNGIVLDPPVSDA